MQAELIRRRDALAALLAEEGRELERAVDDTQALAERYTSLGAVMSRRPGPLVLAALTVGFLIGQRSR
jgi:hypothetical protein